MAQFDVYKNENSLTNKKVPYLLDIQNNILSSINTRVVIPLIVDIKDFKGLTKEFMKDLKLVYQASTKDLAEDELLKLEDKWGKKYPIVLQSWNNKWENLSVYFKYPQDIRKVIYTTNIIESVHRQFRKLTKAKGAFPNDNSLLKLLFMGIKNADKKWTMPMQNWSLTLSQLAIFFEGRLDNELKI